MEDEAALGDLSVQRGVVVEAVFPVGGEAEEGEVEFVGFGDVEDAEDGGDGVEFWGHGWGFIGRGLVDVVLW